METQCQHLTITQCNELLELLHKFGEFFNGKIGTCKKDSLNFRFKEDSNPVCSQPYPVKKVHAKMIKTEVVLLVLLEVPEVANDSEWGDPSFVQPKPE